ncbi:chemotaxis protein CheB [soil metagenome]
MMTPRLHSKPATAAVRVVGIGASAGGLEALEHFFVHVPDKSGLAYVVVQHLDPTRKGMLVELLQRTTKMKVTQVDEGTTVEPDHVYVIPPNRDMGILNRVLHLLEPRERRGLRLPIDFFFRSLADDLTHDSVGVVLSGMGSDGTLGLRAIKEKSGAVFVQTPESAKFDGMPRSAIDAGLADVVAPAEELAERIVGYSRHLPHSPTAERTLAPTEQSALEKTLILLRARTGNDFSHYKKSTLYRRIERRMGLHQLGTIADYAAYIRDNPQESDLLFKELLIGVTNFFRDPAVWAQLATDVIVPLVSAHADQPTLRAWVPSCSTGEEAYSLAIAFAEAIESCDLRGRVTFQIFATDVDADAIARARRGRFLPNIASDVSEERLARFFVLEATGYRVSEDIRRTVIFAPQNVVMDPPFTKLDIVTCRNLLIYLDQELQEKLITLFHYSLNPGGALMLGSAETVGAATSQFTALPGKTRIYRQIEASLREPRQGLDDFPSALTRTRARGDNADPSPNDPAATGTPALVQRILLREFTPPAALVGAKGDILFLSGDTTKFLEPAAGKVSWNVFAMARDGLSSALSDGFHRAIEARARITLRDQRIDNGAESLVVDVEIEPLTEPASLRGTVLIVFSCPTVPARVFKKSPRGKPSQDIDRLENELATAREEMQSSQEELRSAIEELQSANEEMQSANEELTTSKEEMQSMNDELQTVNQELMVKVEELSRASADMNNLLNSTDIATLFLDNALRVRRFTMQATNVIRLIPTDAGRPITDLATDLDYPHLASDAREVLRAVAYKENEVEATGGRWFRVRIMPYRTHDNRIDGVVITFTDVSALKALEAELRRAKAILEARSVAKAGE